MKKQFIAKLVVLCLVLAMLPTAAFAASGWGTNPPAGATITDKKGDIYYWTTDDTDVVAPAQPAPETTTTVEEIPEDGAIEAKVVNGTATVSLTDAAVEGLSELAEDGEIVLEIKTEDATKLNVSVSAKALTELAEKTGADLTIKSTVANITIPNNVLTSEMGTTGNVKISVQATENSVSFSIQVDGKALKGVKGIKVEF